MKKHEIIYTKLDIFTTEKTKELKDLEKGIKKELKEVISLKGLLNCVQCSSKILPKLKQKQKLLSDVIICYDLKRAEVKAALEIDGNREFTKGWIIEMFDPSLTVLMDTYMSFYNGKE